MNQKNQVRLRRYQNLLILSGTGSIFFGFWTVIKSIMTFLTQSDLMNTIIGEDANDPFYVTIGYVFVILILLWILMLRVYIGLCARSEGYGKKKRWFYLVVAILMLAFDIYFFMGFNFNSPVYTSVFDIIVSMIVDLTSMITLAEMIISAFIVKKLSKTTALDDAAKEGGLTDAA